MLSIFFNQLFQLFNLFFQVFEAEKAVEAAAELAVPLQELMASEATSAHLQWCDLCPIWGALLRSYTLIYTAESYQHCLIAWKSLKSLSRSSLLHCKSILATDSRGMTSFQELRQHGLGMVLYGFAMFAHSLCITIAWYSLPPSNVRVLSLLSILGQEKKPVKAQGELKAQSLWGGESLLHTASKTRRGIHVAHFVLYLLS